MFSQSFSTKLPLDKGLLLPTNQNVSTNVFALSQVMILTLIFFRKRLKILNASRNATDWCSDFRQFFWELDAFFTDQILSRSCI